MSTRAKYTRLPAKSEVAENKADTDIILRKSQGYGKYIGRALTLYFDEKKPFVVLRAADRVIDRAIWVAEVLKRKVAGLHQITRLTEQKIVDTYAPKEEGLLEVKVERFLTVIEITLTKEPTAAQKAEPGYQQPIKANEAELLDAAKWEDDKKVRAERRERREKGEDREDRGDRGGRRDREDRGDRRDNRDNRDNRDRRDRGDREDRRDRRDNEERRDNRDNRDNRDRRDREERPRENREGGERRRGRNQNRD